VDAVVVGAGPGGSATAAGLARAGHRVLLLDRAAFPRHKACSEYMSPETVRLLDRLGVMPALDAAGAPLHGTIVTASRGSRLRGKFALAGPAPFRPTGVSVARHVLDHALVAAARDAGAELWERATVEELLYDGGAVAGVLLRDADGRRHALRARLTVGAYGLRSVVARRIGRRRHGRLRRMAFVAHVDGVEGMEECAELHVGARGYVGLNRIGNGRTNVSLVVPAARAADARGRAQAFFLEALEGFPGVGRRVAAGHLVREVLATGPFAAWSSRVAVDGAAVVGDAADFFDPFTGEGIYAALRGGEMLAPHVVAAIEARRGEDADAALREYDRARVREFRGKWAVERLIGAAVSFPPLMCIAARSLALRPNMAHTIVGVCGDFVPASEVLRPTFLARLVLPWSFGSKRAAPALTTTKSS